MEYPYVNIHTHYPEEGVPTITSLGIHPWEAEQHNLANDEVHRAFEQELKGVDAVGEIGLDFACGVDREVQRELFVLQLKLAKEHRKIVVLHSVKSFDATMDILAKFPLRVVIFHGFIGSVDQMRRAIERGYYISFGERTFASPKSLKALRETPIERLFTESDMSRTSIEEIYAKVSKQRIEGVDELRGEIYANYQKIIKL